MGFFGMNGDREDLPEKSPESLLETVAEIWE